MIGNEFGRLTLKMYEKNNMKTEDKIIPFINFTINSIVISLITVV